LPIYRVKCSLRSGRPKPNSFGLTQASCLPSYRRPTQTSGVRKRFPLSPEACSDSTVYRTVYRATLQERMHWAAILFLMGLMPCSLRRNFGNNMAALMVLHAECLLSSISSPLNVSCRLSTSAIFLSLRRHLLPRGKPIKTCRQQIKFRFEFPLRC